MGILLAFNIYTFAIDKIQFSYLAFYLFILSILILYSLKCFIKFRLQTIIYLIPIIYLLFSLIYSRNINVGLKFFMFFFVFILIHIMLTQEDGWHKGFCKTILIMSYIFVIITILAFFFPTTYIKFVFPLFKKESQDIMLRLINVGAQVGMTNQTVKNGFLISLGLGILVNKLLTKKESKIIIYSSIMLYIVALFMTLKRSFIVAHIASILIIFYLNLKFDNKKINKFIKFIFAAISILVFLLLLEPFIPIIERTIARFTIVASQDFTSGRLDIYKAGMELFKERPLIGNGAYSTPTLLGQKFGLYGYQQMHNIYLQFLVEFGLLGTCIFMGLIIKAYIVTYKLYKSYFHYNTEIKFRLGFALYTQSMWLIYGFFGNPFTEHIFLLTYLLLLSITFYYRNKIISNKPLLEND